MGCRPLACSLQEAALYVLLGVVKGTSGVAHEDRPRDRHDRGADQKPAHEADTKQESSRKRHQQSHHRRKDHLPDGLTRGKRDHLIVIGNRRAFQDTGKRHHTVSHVRHDLRGVYGVIRQHSAEVFDQSASDDAARDHGHGGKVQDERISRSSIVADIGNDQGNRGERRRPDRESLADGRRGIADRIQAVCDHSHFRIQMTGLRDPARVIRDGAESIDGDRGAHKGQHAKGSYRDTVCAADISGGKQRHADHQDGGKTGS